jgi:hypothetical protein
MITLADIYSKFVVNENPIPNPNPRNYFESPPDFETDNPYFFTKSKIYDHLKHEPEPEPESEPELELKLEHELIDTNIHPVILDNHKILANSFKNNTVNDDIRSFLGRNTKPQREKIANELLSLNLSDDTCQIIANYLSRKILVFPSKQNTTRCICYKPETETETETETPIMFTRNGIEIVKSPHDTIIEAIPIRKTKQMFSAELKGYLASIGHNEFIHMNKPEVLSAYQDLYLNRDR